MNPEIYLCFLLILLLLMAKRRRTRRTAARLAARRRKKGRSDRMNEYLKDFIGKDCVIYTPEAQYTGKLLGISDNWLLIDTGKGRETVNLDYVARIREYPLDKRGKKKSVVLD